jgi:hypothetical protein
MLGLVEEELNTVLNETNEKPTERKENPADVLRSSEPDSPIHKALQFEFSDDVSGESANKGSDNVILPKGARPVLRQKRSHTGPCYTGNYQPVKLASGALRKCPICKSVTLYGCPSSLTNNGYKRLCVGSDIKTVIVHGTNQTSSFPTTCSCAP